MDKKSHFVSYFRSENKIINIYNQSWNLFKKNYKNTLNKLKNIFKESKKNIKKLKNEGKIKLREKYINEYREEFLFSIMFLSVILLIWIVLKLVSEKISFFDLIIFILPVLGISFSLLMIGIFLYLRYKEKDVNVIYLK